MKKRREIQNKTSRDHIEYVEICKTLNKKAGEAREDIRKHNLDEIRETIKLEKGQKNTQPREKPDDDTPGQTRQRDQQDKIMARIEEFYSQLHYRDQAVTIQTDPEEVPQIMAWEVEAALRKLEKWERSRKRSSKD